MDHSEARAALTESAHRRQQTIDAGSAPWPWRTVLAFAGAFVGLGLSIDADMIWLGALVFAGVATAGTTRAVTLRRTRPSRGWVVALCGTFVLALLADVAVQFAVRGAQLPLPNTWGSVAAAVVIVLLARPAQARVAASLRP